jgi:hypothetical protein
MWTGFFYYKETFSILMSGYVAQHGQPAGFNSHDQEWAQLPQLLASLRNPYPQGPRPSPAHYHLDRVRTGGSSENWTLNPRLFVNECPTESECADRSLGHALSVLLLPLS